MLRRGRHRFIARVPAALVLAVGYAYTAILLLVGTRIAPDHHVHDNRWLYAVISVAFTVWHTAGYLGLVDDGPRKFGYLASGAWLGGFGFLIWLDGARLAAGYIFLACGVAIYAYWQYPRRREDG